MNNTIKDINNDNETYVCEDEALFNNEESILKKYLEEIENFKPLTAQEEKDLAILIQKGLEAEEALKKNTTLSAAEKASLDETIKAGYAAQEQLICAHLKDVLEIAEQYKNMGLSQIDVIQEGNAGLLKATEHYNSSLPYNFATYAVWWIKREIVRAIGEERNFVALGIPRPLFEQVQSIYRFKDSLAQSLKREPSLEELAAYVKMPVERVKFLLSSNPLSYKVESMDDDTEIDSVAYFDKEEYKINPVYKQEIDAAIATLSPKEQTIVSLRLGLSDGSSRSLLEISQQLHITREEVRQVENQALQKIKLKYNA